MDKALPTTIFGNYTALVYPDDSDDSSNFSNTLSQLSLKNLEQEKEKTLNNKQLINCLMSQLLIPKNKMEIKG